MNRVLLLLLEIHVSVIEIYASLTALAAIVSIIIAIHMAVKMINKDKENKV